MVLAGPWGVTGLWRAELGRQTPGRIRKAGVGGGRFQVTCGLRGRAIRQK